MVDLVSCRLFEILDLKWDIFTKSIISCSVRYYSNYACHENAMYMYEANTCNLKTIKIHFNSIYIYR